MQIFKEHQSRCDVYFSEVLIQRKGINWEGCLCHLMVCVDNTEVDDIGKGKSDSRT